MTGPQIDLLDEDLLVTGLDPVGVLSRRLTFYRGGNGLLHGREFRTVNDVIQLNETVALVGRNLIGRYGVFREHGIDLVCESGSYLQRLSPRRPARCAPADFFTNQYLPGFGTAPAVGPAMVEQPGVGDVRIEVGWEIIPDSGNRVQCHPANSAAFAPQDMGFLYVERSGQASGVNPGPPKNFVRHPIAHTGETFLHQQHGFDGSAGATS